MGRSHDDDTYEEGVHDGQKATSGDEFFHNLTKGYTLDPHSNDIYNAGYKYGVEHQSDSDDDD